jgi:endonuclease YncB( thermonuclease family)
MTEPTRRTFLAPALAFLAPFALLAPPAAAAHPPLAQAEAAERAHPEAWAAARIHEPPQETFAVERVVDGDTLWIRRAGELEKLRLLSVDTEERISPDIRASETKPQTAFGEACALWARKLFAELGGARGEARVGLAFPAGLEQRDVYGRLLCHVLLEDGTDFNLLLVLLGKSPYFNKYGNSEICHAAFVAAQARAREAALGIWSPDANRPETPGAPSARRPYELLLPWWQARAEAIDAFRAARADDPRHVLDAEDGAALERAQGLDEEARVFCSIARLYDESNGDLTVLMRSSDERRSLRVRIPRRAREAHEALDLEGTQGELRQNYLWIRGRIVRGARGPEILCEDPARWTPAGPEPALPAEAGSARGG